MLALLGAVRSLLLVVLVFWLGCASYAPDSFSYPARVFPGQRTTVGCIDLSVDRRTDMGDAAVLEYQFGNRCNDAAVVDLQHAHVIGRTLDGTEVQLWPYDPAFEVTVKTLPARKAGSEALAYPAKHQLVQVCVDAASIIEHASGTRWLCFAGKDPTGDVVAEETP